MTRSTMRKREKGGLTMDDLIKREVILDYMKGWKGDTVNFVRNLPAVKAVPLDKLCKWLQENALLSYKTPLSVAGWKYELTQWMEEQNGTDNP
jgi:hypothetical protein